MTELEQFRTFFLNQGVTFEESKYDWKCSPAIWLTVAQAHFIFDVNGNYLGVDPDEMGSFKPKE